MSVRRSVLYVPGSNERALEKAKGLGADALIYDLEDAVAPDVKAAARQNVVNAINAKGFGFSEIVVRINGLTTPYCADDLEAALRMKPTAILLPKVERAADLDEVRNRAKALGPGEGIELWAMIETPLSLFNLKEIAAAGQSSVLPLTCFVLGTNDLIKSMRSKPGPNRAELLGPLSLSVAAARAFGITAVDGVFNAFQDSAGFKAECEQGLRLGMDGKTLIHPSQIAICNEVFSPAPEEIKAAREIVAAFALPENAGKGAINLNGRMVELLHKDIALKTLEIADAIEGRKA
jgi:citrate lyase subunit beta / citryl-CoA lyase